MSTNMIPIDGSKSTVMELYENEKIGKHLRDGVSPKQSVSP